MSWPPLGQDYGTSSFNSYIRHTIEASDLRSSSKSAEKKLEVAADMLCFIMVLTAHSLQVKNISSLYDSRPTG